MGPVPQAEPMIWRKSSRSAGNGNCVEVAFASEVVAVRDSKDPNGSTLQFDVGPWRAFVGSVRRGDFDRP